MWDYVTEQVLIFEALTTILMFAGLVQSRINFTFFVLALSLGGLLYYTLQFLHPYLQVVHRFRNPKKEYRCLLFNDQDGTILAGTENCGIMVVQVLISAALHLNYFCHHHAACIH